MISEVLITGAFIAAIPGVGSICTRLGRRLPLPLSDLLILASCAWSVVGMAAVTLPRLREVGARALSLATPMETVTQIAALVALFYAGLGASRYNDQKRKNGGLWLGLGTAGLVLALGSFAAAHFGNGWQHNSLLVAIAMAPSVALATLTDHNTPQHQVVAAATNQFDQALAAFIVSFLLIFSIFRASSSQLGEAQNSVIAGILLIKTVLFFGFAWFLGSRYARRFAENSKKDLTIRLLVGFILMLMLLYVYASQFLGQLAGLIWAYLAGVLFAKTAFRQPVIRGLKRLTYLVCLPLLFFWAGLKVQTNVWSLAAVMAVIVAILGRVIGASLCAGGRGTEHESVAAGLMALRPAETGVILSAYMLKSGCVSGAESNVLIVAAIVTTVLGTLLLGRVKPPLAVEAGDGPREAEETLP